MLVRTIRRTAVALMLCWGMAHSCFATILNVVVTPNSVPFSYRNENGDLVGFNVDIARAICRELGQVCRIEAVVFPEILSLVTTSRVDLAVANFLKTPERTRQVAFSVPYWRSTSSYIGSSTLTGTSGAQLLVSGGVCAIRETAQMRYLLSLQAQSGGEIHPVDANRDIFDGLLMGQCSAALLPTMQALSFLQSQEGLSFRFIGAPLEEAGLGGTVHIIVRPDDQALLERVNRAIRSLVNSGEHERLSRRYFPFSIY